MTGEVQLLVWIPFLDGKDAGGDFVIESPNAKAVASAHAAIDARKDHVEHRLPAAMFQFGHCGRGIDDDEVAIALCSFSDIRLCQSAVSISISNRDARDSDDYRDEGRPFHRCLFGPLIFCSFA